VKKLTTRQQRTIARAVEVRGVGFLSGADVRLRFVPAPPHSGVVFVRTDLPAPVRLAARADLVTGTHRRTTLGRPPHQVELVEHVLSALAGMRIDNCVVELNAMEPPGLDGSAQQFVEALARAGVVGQAARRSVWSVEQPILLEQDGARLGLFPADDHQFKISYVLDYGPGSPIGYHSYSEVINPETFGNYLANTRTFLLDAEAAHMKRQGLGLRTTFADLLVFGPGGPIGNRLRYADEPARHKVLDLVGDLSLFGHDLCGHVVAYRSGHPLNYRLVQELTRLLPPSAAAPLAA
jgi:UDP-3-O-acyl N-acetylglucosamine deacetylase